MMKNLLITGAAGYLGKDVVAAAKLAGSYRMNIVSRENVSSDGYFKVFNIDLLNEQATNSLINEIVETQSIPDAVLFLAGGYTGGGITENTASDFLRMIEINLITVHNIARPLVQYSRNSSKGLRFIIVGAKAAMNLSLSVNNVAYAVSKNALLHYAALINES